MHILHLEDSSLDHELVKRELNKTGEAITTQHVETLADFARALEQETFDVILADYRLPGFTALDAWNTMQSLHLRTPFVLISGAIGE